MSYFINLSLLRHNSNFRLLYLGQFISFFGTMITAVALPYQIYHETQSTLMVGLLSLCQLLPLLLTALLGGVLADRHHRRTLLIITEILLALGCLLLAWNAFATTPSITIIFVVAIIMSAVNGLHRPALDSMTQQVVAKEDFHTISGLSTFKFSACMIGGPAVGGLLIASFGLTITFILDFISFLISLFALLMMAHIPKPKRLHDSSAWSSVKQGFHYAVSRQELMGSYFIDFIAMVFSMPTALFPAIAQTHGGAKTLGLLYAAPAVGALFISCFSGWTSQVKRHGLAIAIAAAFWGISMIFFGLAENFWLALFFLSLAGAFDAVSGIFRMTLWNETIPNELRGRLSGIEMISYLSGPKLGDAYAGLVSTAIGITATVVSGGLLCVFGVTLCCYLLPKFRRYHAEESIHQLTLPNSEKAS